MRLVGDQPVHIPLNNTGGSVSEQLQAEQDLSETFFINLDRATIDTLPRLRNIVAFWFASYAKPINNPICCEDFKDAHLKFDTLLSACNVEVGLDIVLEWGMEYLCEYFKCIKEELELGDLRGRVERRSLIVQAEVPDYLWKVPVFFAATSRQRLYERQVEIKTSKPSIGAQLPWQDWIAQCRREIMMLLRVSKAPPISLWHHRQCPVLNPLVHQKIHCAMDRAVDFQVGKLSL
jgi:hypothetical protein